MNTKIPRIMMVLSTLALEQAAMSEWRGAKRRLYGLRIRGEEDRVKFRHGNII